MNETRAILIDGDVDTYRKLMPAGTTRAQAEIGLHISRTHAESVPFKLRAYSHRWLLERSLPSKLPNILRPKAERIEKVVQEGVAISANVRDPIMMPVAIEIRTAMENIVNDMYSSGTPDPVKLRREMMFARDRTKRKLLG